MYRYTYNIQHNKAENNLTWAHEHLFRIELSSNYFRQIAREKNKIFCEIVTYELNI